jgi:hypothetical protein
MGQLAASAVSDSVGNWAIGELASGNYQITASTDSYYAETKLVVVGAEQTTQVDFALVAISKSKKDTGAVKGLVVGNTGEPLKRVKLRFYHSDGQSAGSASTNTAGHFCKSGLSPDNYTVVAEKSPYQTSQTTLTVTVASVEETALQLETQSITTAESTDETGESDWRSSYL